MSRYRQSLPCLAAKREEVGKRTGYSGGSLHGDLYREPVESGGRGIGRRNGLSRNEGN